MKLFNYFFHRDYLFGAVLLSTRFLWYLIYAPVSIYPDSKEYISFSVSHLFSSNSTFSSAGLLSETQPPLYGTFLDFFQFLFPSPIYLYFVVLFQIIFSALSLWFIYHSLLLLNISVPLAKMIVILYNATSAVNGWDTCILTESLSLSLGCIVIFFSIKMVLDPKLLYGISALFFSFLLAFLRPQYLTYPVILIAYYIWQMFINKAHRKLLIKWICFSIAGFCFVFSYCLHFKQSYGIFSLSAALPRQKMMVCISNGFYNDCSDPNVVNFIDRQLSQLQQSDSSETNIYWNTTLSVIDHYGNAQTEKVANECISANKKDYLSYVAKCIYDWSSTKFQGYAQRRFNEASHDWSYRIGELLSCWTDYFTVLHALIIPLLAGIASVVQWVRKKEIPWIQLGLWSLGSSIVYPTFFVTNAEFARTMVGIVPFLYIWTAMFLQWFPLYFQFSKESPTDV